MEKKSEQKKMWTTPKLVVHGDVEKITREGSIPPKVFGAKDGAMWAGQSVKWAS